jgi:LPXTG-motif cell wall-anchored protein
MKKFVLTSLLAGLVSFSAMGAYQYEAKGNQGWLTFNSETTVAFDLARSGKDKDHENFIDRGEGIVDFGWYNLDTGTSGSFNNGLAATFSANDRIGLYVTDNKGNTYLSTKPRSPFEDDIWGKARIVDGNLHLYGGNLGSNGTHEYYVFKVNNANASGKTPSGQPLPGIIATVLIGGGALVYLKKRKKLLAEK